MIHLVHDFGGETVLIFGGGPVGARRARSFEDAEVIVVSPEFDGDFAGASLVRADPTGDDARELVDRVEPALVVAATDDDEINAEVAMAAREFGALVNRADRSAVGPGSVDVPATARDGPVVASVSTGGRSPALSAHLRDRIAEELVDSGKLAAVLGDLRSELRDRDVRPDLRREVLRSVVEDDSVWRALRNGDAVEPTARRTMEDHLGRMETGRRGDR